MLRTTLVCTAILVGTAIGTIKAQAQYGSPYPSIGQIQSSGYGCGQNYDCMQNSRDRLGSSSPYANDYNRDSYGWHHGYDRGAGDDRGAGMDYGYHPRDSYDWHHGYDRGE